MRSVVPLFALVLGVTFAQPHLAQAQAVKIAGIVELSGTGATSGTNFNDGVKLAVKEINAAGGILGRKIDYSSNDTQSQPQVAKALAVKAIDDDAYVVMGPVFSGSILVSMAETRRAGVPNFTGGEATQSPSRATRSSSARPSPRPPPCRKWRVISRTTSRRATWP